MDDVEYRKKRRITRIEKEKADEKERVQEHLRVCKNMLLEYYGRDNGDTLTWKIHEMSRMLGCEHEEIARFLKTNGLLVPREYENA